MSPATNRFRRGEGALIALVALFLAAATAHAAGTTGSSTDAQPTCTEFCINKYGSTITVGHEVQTLYACTGPSSTGVYTCSYRSSPTSTTSTTITYTPVATAGS